MSSETVIVFLRRFFFKPMLAIVGWELRGRWILKSARMALLGDGNHIPFGGTSSLPLHYLPKNGKTAMGNGIICVGGREERMVDGF